MENRVGLDRRRGGLHRESRCQGSRTGGAQPVVLDNFVYGHKWAVKWGPLVEGDLGDRAFVDRVLKEHGVTSGHPLRGLRLRRRVGHRPAQVLPQQRRRHAQPARRDGRPRRARHRLLHHLRHLRRARPRCRSPKTSADADQPLRRIEADAVERSSTGTRRRYGLGFAALRYFNAAGADPDGEIGEDHDPETHLIPLAHRGGARARPELSDLRHRLPDARRHRDPRLHPRRRPRRGAHARARTSLGADARG